MTRKRQSTNAFRIVLFIAVIALAGYGLAATGHFSNPFGFLTQIQGHAGGPPAGIRNGAAGNATQPQPTGQGSPDRTGSSINVNWSQIGDVLFNLWFLGATTAVVIVVQKLGRHLIQEVRRRRQPLAA